MKVIYWFLVAYGTLKLGEEFALFLALCKDRWIKNRYPEK